MKNIVLLLFIVSPFFCVAQNVGVGTTTPQTTFDVKGNLRIGGMTKYMSYDSLTGHIEWKNSALFVPATQQLIQHSASSEGLFYDNGQLEYRNHLGSTVFSTNWSTGRGYFSDKLGIGTTTPTTKVHIFSGPSGATPFYLSDLTVESSHETYMSLLSSNAYESGILFGIPEHFASGSILYNLPATPRGFQFRVNGNSTKMMLTNNGTLRFNGQLGPIIDLLYAGENNRYGFGVVENRFQVYAASSDDDILFGYGSSAVFTENMRIRGNGSVGIGTDNPTATLEIKSQTGSPQLIVNQQSETDYSRINFRNDNTSSNGRSWDIAGFIDGSTINNDRLNFFMTGTGNILSLTGNGNVGIGTTSPTHKLQVEGTSFINGNVGIGNSNPTAPLTFAAALGKKITLYPGGSGDAGFGMSGNRLQIYADNAAADVAIGYDAGGTFIERFAVKANGAISVNGNTGFNGLVLQSTGNGTPPVWVSPTSGLYNSATMLNGGGPAIPLGAPLTVDIPGLIKNYSTGAGLSLLVSFNVDVNAIFCPGCFPSQIFIDIAVNNGTIKTFPFSIPNSGATSCSGTYLITFQTNIIAEVKIRLTYAGAAPGIIVTPGNSNMVLIPFAN